MAGDPGLAEKIVAQRCAIPYDGDGTRFFRQLRRQLLQGDSPVLRQPGERPLLCQKQGVVDLLAPGIHSAENELALQMAEGRSHCFQGGDGDAGLLRPPGEALGRGDADAQPRKGAGAGGHGDGVHVA